MAHCNSVWGPTIPRELSGHCFRIGGTTELLLRGVAPHDVTLVPGVSHRDHDDACAHPYNALRTSGQTSVMCDM
jgi:hypothetical protein